MQDSYIPRLLGGVRFKPCQMPGHFLSSNDEWSWVWIPPHDTRWVCCLKRLTLNEKEAGNWLVHPLNKAQHFSTQKLTWKSLDQRRISKFWWKIFAEVGGVAWRGSCSKETCQNDAQTNQCDQIGRFIGLWVTFQSLWQQSICPFLSNFCKGVKIFNFCSEVIFGQLL